MARTALAATVNLSRTVQKCQSRLFGLQYVPVIPSSAEESARRWLGHAPVSGHWGVVRAPVHSLAKRRASRSNQSEIPANSHILAAATGCGQLHTRKNKASRHQRPAG